VDELVTGTGTSIATGTAKSTGQTAGKKKKKTDVLLGHLLYGFYFLLKLPSLLPHLCKSNIIEGSYSLSHNGGRIPQINRGYLLRSRAGWLERRLLFLFFQSPR
jgi:hypothetical protein